MKPTYTVVVTGPTRITQYMTENGHFSFDAREAYPIKTEKTARRVAAMVGSSAQVALSWITN